jgi:PadR family transcriptional regulator, regulatory protein PadR
MSKPSERKNLLQGTLDLMILGIVSREPMHGWGIVQRLRRASNDVFQVTPGSLFPALQRLEDNGWVSTEWITTENNRRAKYYTLTRAGRRQLDRQAAHWKIISVTVTTVLEGA